ncbi:hypothetical protein DICVIV_10906 [Dictyocaulus viviparus]|uniref:Uncharacterized protein n=1 Tax=Dictyocaulus viviparus TaxID=29172 RepID=A0A0D8XEK6_DICVI|nr:hypothetical protein DICVIV_10906 [Dictyocaulus viviparus]
MSLVKAYSTKPHRNESRRVGTLLKPSDTTSKKSTTLSRQFIGDSFDKYLDTIGLVKKAMLNDNGSSVYRAVCESLSMDQSEHTTLQEFVEGELLFQYSLQRIRNGLPCVNKIEDTLTTLSRLLGIEIHVYRVINDEPVVYNWNSRGCKSSEKVMLCETSRGHFDLVISRKDHMNLANAQSYVYELLYVHVFGFKSDVIKKCIKRIREDIDAIDAGTRTSSVLLGQSDKEFLPMKSGHGMWRPPMPYSAIKSLDPSIYRNLCYDMFLRSRRRELVETGMFHAGTSCLLLENNSFSHAAARADRERDLQIVCANEQERKVHVSNLMTVSKEPHQRAKYTPQLTNTNVHGLAHNTVGNPVYLHASATCYPTTAPLYFVCNSTESVRFQYGYSIMPNNPTMIMNSTGNNTQVYVGAESHGANIGSVVQFPMFYQQDCVVNLLTNIFIGFISRDSTFC